MLKRTLVSLLTITLSFLLFSGCQKTENEGIYITYARTSASLASWVFSYDLTADEITENGKFPYSAHHADGVYNKINNKIYYSAEAANGLGDQLWEYDLETRVRTQLTDSLTGIEHIIPVGDNVYLEAIHEDNQTGTVNLFCYSISGKTLTLLQNDPTLSINALNYNPEINAFIFVSKDNQELSRQLEANGLEEPFYPPVNNVYLMKDAEIIPIFSTNTNENIDTIVMNDKSVLYRTSSYKWIMQETGSYALVISNHIYLLDRQTKRKTQINAEAFDSVNKFIYLTKNNDLYCFDKDGKNVRLIKFNLNDPDNIKVIDSASTESYYFNNDTGVTLN